MEISVDLFSIGLIAWLVLAILGRPLNDLLMVSKALLCSPIDSLTKGLTGATSAVRAASPVLAQYALNFWVEISAIFGKAVNVFDRAIGTVRSHLGHVSGLITVSPQAGGWRILGALIYMAALIAFLYADMAQGANNLSGLYPDLQVPSILQNLAVPLVIASGGTALALGMIMGDFLGKTDLAPWSALQGKARKIVLAIVLTNLVASVVLALFLSLVRVKELLQLQLAPTDAQLMQVLASFAQSVVIVPLLTTTFLLFWGVAGFLAIWLFIVALALLALGIIRHLTALFGVLASGLGNVSSALVTIGLVLLEVLFIVLSWFFNALRDIIAKSFYLLQAILRLVIYPLVAFYSWIIRFDWPREKLKLGPREQRARPTLDVGFPE